jgi:hypothetical protein
MPVIRRRYNYGNVLLNPNIVSDKFCLAGQTVDVLLSSGDIAPFHFVGFQEVAEFKSVVDAIKLVNISGYSADDDELFGRWVHYCNRTVLLGCRVDNGVMLCIDASTRSPMAWCALPGSSGMAHEPPADLL